MVPRPAVLYDGPRPAGSGDMEIVMSKMHTIATHVGDIIAASLIRLDTVNATRGGYVQCCPRATLAIGLRASDGGWEPLYEMGADWDGVSDDNVDDVLSLGELDDQNDIADALEEGADILDAWADKITAIDPANEDLGEVADWLRGRATSARAAALDDAYIAEIQERRA
jgi:hypothetical protein